MSAYNIIVKAIEKYLNMCGGGYKKIAIYPLGNVGMQVKEVLNFRYGIKEAILVDNYLAGINPDVTAFEEVNNYEEYIWILTCGNPDFHSEILSSIKLKVSENQIIDMFENLSCFSEDYHLLSKLGVPGGETISLPCKEFLDLIKKKKSENRIITVAELGVGFGATAVEACRLLDKEDTYFCFDFDDVVEDLIHDLSQCQDIQCKLVGKGNSHKECDSYNWNLSSLLFQMRNNRLKGLFDIVYLDGSHTFAHDGLACCLLKQLLKKGGYLIFDDVSWVCKGNEELYNEWQKLYTEEQLSSCQVQRVINAFMVEDKRFRQIYMTQSLNPYRAVYYKIK